MGNKLEAWLSGLVYWAMTQWLALESRQRKREFRVLAKRPTEIEIFRSRLEASWSDGAQGTAIKND